MTYMKDNEVIFFFEKNKEEFIKNYIKEIESRYINFKKSKDLERYEKVIRLWKSLLSNENYPNNDEILIYVRETEKIGYIYPDAVFNIKDSDKKIKEITSRFTKKKQNYWMHPDPASFPKNPDQKAVAVINVFWYLVGRPVNFNLTKYKKCFAEDFSKALTICEMVLEDAPLFEEIYFFSRNQFCDYLLKNQDQFKEVISKSQICFCSRYNRV